MSNIFSISPTALVHESTNNVVLLERQLDVRQQELKSQREDRLMRMIEYAEKNNNMAQAQWLHSQLLESLMNDPVGTTSVAMPVTRDAPQQQETAMVKEFADQNLTRTLSLCQPIPKKRQASGSLEIVRATKKLKLDSRDESNVDGKMKKFV
jgi:hypothetical protein